jgi:hypothetical protein
VVNIVVVDGSYCGLSMRFRKIAKSDYYFRHVRPSVHPPAGNNSTSTLLLDGFDEI